MWEALSGAVSRAAVGDWLLLLATALVLLWVAGTWNYDHFARRGIPSTHPRIPFFGDSLPGIVGIRSIPDSLLLFYEKGKGHAVFGLFEFMRPIYNIRDPELIKVVAVKDFDSFMNHRALVTEDIEELFMKSLFNLKDDRWRDMRTTLSPAFTASRVRGMFPLIAQCAEQMAEHLRRRGEGASAGAEGAALEVDMKNLLSRVANDVIATVAFGIHCDSLKEPQNEFYRMGKALTTISWGRMAILFLHILLPKIMTALRLRVFSPAATDFFSAAVRAALRERRRGLRRPDMLQLLLQAQEGRLRAAAEDAREAEGAGGARRELTDEDVCAQAMLFFFAGFETVSTALCFAAHALSHHPEVQRRLQQEVDGAMEQSGGRPTYEAVQAMKYLDCVVNETLRLYPPNITVDRICKKDTTLPPTATSGPVSLKKGDAVIVLPMGLHHDPQYWEEPEKFDPNRFNEENKHNVKPFTFLPFGMGPRTCIGQRMAMVEVKLALIHLLHNFDLQPSPKTKHPMEFVSAGFSLSVAGGFWTKLRRREV